MKGRTAFAGIPFALLVLSGVLSGVLLGCRSNLEQAKACYRVGDFHRARELFNQAIAEDPMSFEARYGLALVVQENSLQKKAMGLDNAEDWSEVVQAYDICTRLGGETSLFAQNYAFALFHLANKLYQDQKYAAARDYLQQARKLDPRNKYTLNLAGVVAYNLANYKEAQEIFEYLLAVDPDFLSAYLNLGNVFWENHKPDEAIATWKNGLKRTPGEPTLLSRLDVALKAMAAAQNPMPALAETKTGPVKHIPKKTALRSGSAKSVASSTQP